MGFIGGKINVVMVVLVMLAVAGTAGATLVFQNKISQLEDQNEELRGTTQDQKKELVQTQDELEQTKDELAEAEQELEDVQQLSSNFKQASNRADQLEGLYQEAEQNASRYASENEKLDQWLAENKSDKLQWRDDYMDLKGEAQPLQSEYREVRSEYTELYEWCDSGGNNCSVSSAGVGAPSGFSSADDFEIPD